MTNSLNWRFLTQWLKLMARGHLSVWDQWTNFKRWKFYLQNQRSSTGEKLPWLTFPAIDYLKKNLKKTDSVFEYGGGGSTLFFLEHASRVTTVEHDLNWFN